MQINKIIDPKLNTLSKGELQRLMCWATATTKSNVYIFDEPSNFLDVKQRLEVSRLIRAVSDNNPGSYIIVIEHDLSILYYISDEIYIIYGNSGAYEIVSKPLTTLEGINVYLSGFISTQNIRFRNEEFNLKPMIEQSNNLNSANVVEKIKSYYVDYPESIIKFTGYELFIPKEQLNYLIE